MHFYSLGEDFFEGDSSSTTTIYLRIEVCWKLIWFNIGNDEVHASNFDVRTDELTYLIIIPIDDQHVQEA